MVESFGAGDEVHQAVGLGGEAAPRAVIAEIADITVVGDHDIFHRREVFGV